jgi:S1-C subfamily serine protease
MMSPVRKHVLFTERFTMSRTFVIAVACMALGTVAALLATQPPGLGPARGQIAPGPVEDGAGLAQRQPPPPILDGPAASRLPDIGSVPAAPPLRTLGDDELSADERINVRVYEQCNRSVVNITTKAVRADNFFMLETPQEGSGSGSIFDRQGHVLTNYHVVEGAQTINVTLFNGKTYPAKLVGQDPPTDIAVLRIEAPSDSLFPVVLGDSSRLRVGQRAFAIGNPFGLERTFTTGVISSLNRTLPTRTNRSLKSIIQVDAAINPGSSGGPLLDSRGRLIGMNTAIASKTGQSAGVGFAIPVGTIARIVPQLIANGRVIRPEIGITRVLESDHGLVIVALTSGGPAERAGLQGFRVVKERRQIGPFVEERRRVDRSTADTILAVNGEKVTSAEQFLLLIEAHRPGEEVELTVIRDGRREAVRVRLAAGES